MKVSDIIYAMIVSLKYNRDRVAIERLENKTCWEVGKE